MAESAIASAARWIAMQMVTEANFLLGVQNRVLNLQRELNHIQPLLRDVHSPEEVGDANLQIFIGEIRGIAFRAEDVIDEYILDVASRNAEDGCFLGGCVCFFAKILRIHQVGKDIQAILKDSQEAFRQLQQYQVPRAIAGEGPSNDNSRPKQAGNYKVLTYSHTDDGYVVGRDTDIKELVELLKLARWVTPKFWKQKGNPEERIVAIVGTGGVGKTTLARRIYKDQRVKDHCKRAAWVTISQQWSTKDLLLQILSQTGAIKDDQERNLLKDLSEPELVVKTHHFLKKKRHLVVLDDMWMADSWKALCSAFPCNGGSRIIVTTRNEDLPVIFLLAATVTCCHLLLLSPLLVVIFLLAATVTCCHLLLLSPLLVTLLSSAAAVTLP